METRKTNYFGVCVSSVENTAPKSTFQKTDSTFSTLGDKIMQAAKYGADLGAPVSVTYDEADSSDVDILSSPNHDFFDIAEEFGKMVDLTTPPANVENE